MLMAPVVNSVHQLTWHEQAARPHLVSRTSLSSIGWPRNGTGHPAVHRVMMPSVLYIGVVLRVALQQHAAAWRHDSRVTVRLTCTILPCRHRRWFYERVQRQPHSLGGRTAGPQNLVVPHVHEPRQLLLHHWPFVRPFLHLVLQRHAVVVRLRDILAMSEARSLACIIQRTARKQPTRRAVPNAAMRCQT